MVADLEPIRRRVDLTLRLMPPPVLRGLNLVVLAMWRLGLGWMLNAIPPLFGRYMVITTTGRRTGRTRRSSVNYVRLGERVYCIAGWSPRSSWYANLLADPRVELWLPGEQRAARAARVTDPAEASLALRRLLQETRTLSRLLAGVDVGALTEETVAALADWWPVVRFELGDRLRGRPRPDDLAWVWVAAAGVLACRRCRRRYPWAESSERSSVDRVVTDGTGRARSRRERLRASVSARPAPTRRLRPPSASALVPTPQ